ncbi:MAG TPA: SLBB domain-containing protein [Geomonas sp.]|nr:SLBB domain-containing protein [Geomonas sp.]
MRYLVAMLLFLQILLVPALCRAAIDSGDALSSAGISGTGGAGSSAAAAAAGTSASAAADSASKQGQDAATNGKLELRGEPADGEIVLTWYVTEQGPGKPVSFVVSYHGDLDKVEKKQDQVKKSPYRLRGLKNGQHYCVRVAGFSNDGKEVVSSEELTLTPLPSDELNSPTERTFTASLPRKPNGEKITLRQFGYDFFSNSAAASLDNQPVGSDYVVGPGDALRIDLWGSMQARYDLVVDRNGEIVIPKVGAVKVWGLNYSQLRAVIDKAFSRYFRGYELNVTLGRLRSIQVFVVGEVREPGSYTVSSLATAINALSAAGGPTKNGSLRRVRLLRGGKTVQEIDLYAMFLSGDRSRDLRVENGDTLFVPLIGPVAAVAGEVKRPAIYELKSEKTLPVLLDMAGGITAAADNTRIQVERLEQNSARVILDYHPRTRGLENELSTVAVADRDLVKVFPFYDETRGLVTLKGNVAKPGPYQFHQGMRLKELIPSFDALLPDTYLGAVEITRLQLPDRHREKLSANLGKALAGDSRENLELREQDEVLVFSRWDMQEHPMVSVTGEVMKPGSYQFYPHMTVRDLLTSGGSLKRNALLGSAELTRIEVKGGVAVPARVNLDLQKVLAGDPAANLTLQPDDMLIVRSITNWVAEPDRFMTLKGEVRYPGMYSIASGERLSSVINRAGGFTGRAYLRGARFTRKSVQELQQKRMDEVIARSEQQILKKQSEASAVASSSEDMAATKSSLDSLLKNLEILKSKKAEGRIVITLLPPEQLAKTEYDLELMGGDELEVPVTPSVVSVLGEVYNPTTFVYQDRETISGYLKKSGGPVSEAAPGDTYVVRVDGTVTSREQSSFGLSWDESEKRWHFGSFMSRTLWPGDTIVVPQNYDHIAWLREIKDLTTIVSQVALTAGTIFLYFK